MIKRLRPNKEHQPPAEQEFESCLSIKRRIIRSNSHTLWDPAGQGVEVDVGVAAREVVPTHHLHVRFLQQRYPQLVPVAGVGAEGLVAPSHRQLIVHHHLPGNPVEVQLDHVLPGRVVHRVPGLVLWEDDVRDQLPLELLLVLRGDRDRCNKAAVRHASLLHAIAVYHLKIKMFFWTRFPQNSQTSIIFGRGINSSGRHHPVSLARCFGLQKEGRFIQNSRRRTITPQSKKASWIWPWHRKRKALSKVCCYERKILTAVDRTRVRQHLLLFRSVVATTTTTTTSFDLIITPVQVPKWFQQGCWTWRWYRRWRCSALSAFESLCPLKCLPCYQAQFLHQIGIF